MKLARFVCDLVKSAIRPSQRVLRRWYRRLSQQHRNLEETQQYWENPPDAKNAPARYIDHEGRSRFLVQLVQSHIDQNGRVLEIGCNVGRNLAYLHAAGYRNLVAVEISENALKLLRRTYPQMAEDARLVHAPIEEAIRNFAAGEFDLVFTMAVLEHIHRDSEWVFGEIARITGGHLITIEDEECYSWRHFPRNYRDVFQCLGMVQIEETDCAAGGCTDIPAGFRARVFRRRPR